MKKTRTLKAATLLLAGALLTSSCVGSFTLFNKLASWNREATSNKFINELIFIVISPVYGICSFADAVVLNSIEFWTGSNPVASNEGKTQQIMGTDGQMYAVKTVKNGYEISMPNGELVKLVYDKATNSWSECTNNSVRELFRFNNDGTIKLTLNDGEQLDVTPDEVGLYQVRMAMGNGNYWAAN